MTQNADAQRLIETGADLAGAAVGGALGFLAAGPFGAASAGALGVLISRSASKLLGDIANRSLSSREQERVGATAAIALNKIKNSIESGTEPRDDGFFNARENNRSPAEEILEGTLRKAREEHEEKKIGFLGNFFHNVAFSPGVSVSEANYYLSLIDNLTYRQLLVLGLLLLKPQARHPLGLRSIDYRTSNSNLLVETVTLLQEIYSLNNFGLVTCKSASGSGYEACLGWHDIAPDRLVLTDLGERLGKLLFGASGIDWADLEKVINTLR